MCAIQWSRATVLKCLRTMSMFDASIASILRSQRTHFSSRSFLCRTTNSFYSSNSTTNPISDRPGTGSPQLSKLRSKPNSSTFSNGQGTIMKRYLSRLWRWGWQGTRYSMSCGCSLREGLRRISISLSRARITRWSLTASATFSRRNLYPSRSWSESRRSASRYWRNKSKGTRQKPTSSTT